jgi:hypothetical protein
MANTSGATGFNLDLTELVEEAFERAGSELRTGYDLRTARRSLNIMFADWANRGINLWTIETGVIDLVQGQNTYPLPDDTIDLLEHVIRTGANVAATQADLSITRISVSTYATIPNKITQARPIQIWIQRYNGQTSPVSSTLTTTITSTSTEIVLSDVTGLPAAGFIKIDNEIAGGGVNIMDVPFRFIPCMAAGLSYYIAGKIPTGMERIPMLKAQYDEAWELAAYEDHEKAALRLVPRQTYIGR